MDRIYRYNPNANSEPNGGRYLQLITAKDLYIQNITVAEHDDDHSDSFQVKFPNVFTNYPLGAVRVEDQRFKDWDHYKLTLWQSQLNFAVFCASSACGVSVEHLNANRPLLQSLYRFHFYYHIRRILKVLEIHYHMRILSINTHICRIKGCGGAGWPPPPIIFERLKLPQQIIYRRKENLSESPNHQKYWENILVSRFYEQFSRNRRNLGHFRKFEKISNS